MTLRVKVSLRAALQIRKAAQWWAENRSAAPDAVRTDIGSALGLLAAHPGIGARYEGAKVKDIRRLLVRRIGYFLYYRVTPGTLEVLAVWHVSRRKQPSL